MQTETIMDALLQNAALHALAINKHDARAFAGRRSRGSDSSCAAANHGHIIAARTRTFGRFVARCLVGSKLGVVFRRCGNDMRTRKTLRHVAWTNARLARDDLRELWRAKTAMATSHHGIRPPFQCIEAQHGKRRRKRRSHIGLRDFATAAHDMARRRIGRNSLAALFFIHVLKELRHIKHRVELGVFSRAESFGNARGHIGCNRRRRGKARRFKARDIEKARRLANFADFKVARIARSTHARERGNAPAHGKPGVRLSSGLCYFRKTLGRSGRCVLILLGVRIRPHEQIAVHGRGHEHTLARFRGRLEHSMREQAAHVGVHKIVFAAASGNRERVRGDHIVDLIRMHASRIDHRAGVDVLGANARMVFDMQNVAFTFGSAHADNATLEVELNAVSGGIFGAAKRHLVRIANSARRNEQRAFCLGGNVRLKLAQFGRIYHAQAFNTVLLPAIEQFMQCRKLIVAERYYERAVLLVRKSQLMRPLWIQLRSGNVVARLAGARFWIVTGMNDAAVRARSAIGHVEPRLKNNRFHRETSTFACRGATSHSCADDSDIAFAHKSPLGRI